MKPIVRRPRLYRPRKNIHYEAASIDTLLGELAGVCAEMVALVEVTDKFDVYRLRRKEKRLGLVRDAIARKVRWFWAEIAKVSEAEGMTPTSVVPPIEGMVLTVAVTLTSASLAEQLGLPSAVIKRGTVVPIEALAHVRNAQSMLNAGMLRWMPPSAPKPVPVARTNGTKSPMPVVVDDPVRDLRLELRKHVAAGKSWSEAEDLVIATPVGAQLYERAQSVYSRRPGQPPGSRSVRGFREFLQAEA
jgi:hypothetical protein